MDLLPIASSRVQPLRAARARSGSCPPPLAPAPTPRPRRTARATPLAAPRDEQRGGARARRAAAVARARVRAAVPAGAAGPRGRRPGRLEGCRGRRGGAAGVQHSRVWPRGRGQGRRRARGAAGAGVARARARRRRRRTAAHGASPPGAMLRAMTRASRARIANAIPWESAGVGSESSGATARVRTRGHGERPARGFWRHFRRAAPPRRRLPLIRPPRAPGSPIATCDSI